jgi:DNA topoisomerase I
MTIPDPSAVTGLSRSDPHGPGISRVRTAGTFAYRDPAGAGITDSATLDRIRALALPPAWADVWISADPLGHIQATGTDARGRTQYRYHQRWREQRDAQKFEHMLRFAGALPGLRANLAHDVSAYMAGRAGGHFTAKEFRTWNATVLMALQLANAGPSADD